MLLTSWISIPCRRKLSCIVRITWWQTIQQTGRSWLQTKRNNKYNSNINTALVMQRYIVQTIYRVDIGHIVSYRHRQEKYRNFDISLSFRYRFNIKRRRCCLLIFFFFVGKKSRTAHIMTLKRSLACRPNHNSTVLGLKLKYRPLHNSLN